MSMKGLRFSAIACVVGLAVFLSSCYDDSFVPYLAVAVEDEYPPGTVTIGYSFESEREEQVCRVHLLRGSEIEPVYADDVKLPRSGTLEFDIPGTGNYTLYFAVLSERKGTLRVIPFLEQSHSFIVR